MKIEDRNEGFSLVELIVVVLIMGIVAVALAPQVMKWAEKSKHSTDFQAMDSLKEVAQVALAEYEIEGNTLADENYIITSSGAVVADGGVDANSGMTTILQYYMNGSYPKVQVSSGKVFQIQMQADGKKVDVTIVTGTY